VLHVSMYVFMHIQYHMMKEFAPKCKFNAIAVVVSLDCGVMSAECLARKKRETFELLVDKSLNLIVRDEALSLSSDVGIRFDYFYYLRCGASWNGTNRLDLLND
jgi:hypothetical protein